MIRPQRLLLRFVVPTALLLPFSSQADTRTWEFNIKTPGVYELHAQHKYEKSDAPREFVATYSIQTQEKTDKREIAITLNNEEGYRVAILPVKIANRQKISVVVTG